MSEARKGFLFAPPRSHRIILEQLGRRWSRGMPHCFHLPLLFLAHDPNPFFNAAITFCHSPLGAAATRAGQKPSAGVPQILVLFADRLHRLQLG